MGWLKFASGETVGLHFCHKKVGNKWPESVHIHQEGIMPINGMQTDIVYLPVFPIQSHRQFLLLMGREKMVATDSGNQDSFGTGLYGELHALRQRAHFEKQSLDTHFSENHGAFLDGFLEHRLT